jgi:2-haloalkanoic acid dehalogenase type II
VTKRRHRQQPPVRATKVALPAQGSPALPRAEAIAALVQLANEHVQAGRFDEAEKLLRPILAEAPNHHRAMHLLGILAVKHNRLDEALGLMERSIVLAPREGNYHRNICELYRILGRFDDALAAGRRAVTFAPDDVHSHHNLAVLHFYRHELDKAIAAAERALTIDPKFANAHLRIAEAALLRGDFARGWEEYEWRFKIDGAQAPTPWTGRVQWNGEPLQEGALLLVVDQGYGDVIQFARYIPWAAERCQRLVIGCCPELLSVVRQYKGPSMIFERWEEAPDFAAYSTLSSLPRLAGSRLETIPAEDPLLQSDPVLTAHWAERLSALVPAGYRRIGIAWAGRPTHTNDRERSTELATLLPLADLPRTALVSLQMGVAAAEIGAYQGEAPLIDLSPEIHDFGDTMAILDNLECLVTVDTAVAHLAGAMGKQALVMLPHVPDWRWLLHRSDTPWYRSLRLYRQGPDRSWGSVVNTIAADLATAARPCLGQGADPAPVCRGAPSMNLTDFKALTFDCYGTLIDWESGMIEALQPLTARVARTLSRNEILEAHARHESAQQMQTPAKLYSDLLAIVYRRLAEEWGAAVSWAECVAYGRSVCNWPAFPDSVAALTYLKRHYKLVILSNVDNESFASSNERLRVAFDAIYTAEDVGAYKPSDRNFAYMLAELQSLGIQKHEILHVAESMFHDHGPANRHGLASCWIYRRHEQEGFGATRRPVEMPKYDFRFDSMAELVKAHEQELQLSR